ncbi:MAG: hypothetical protein KGI56_01545 [Acidobacteriota bacterium]|nr:hypothetical protein [Acidobacteriota bacterium]
MTSSVEREEIIKKGSADGQRLFIVSETIYKVLIIFNWIMGLLGGIVGLVLMAQAGNGNATAFFIGIFILFATAVTCVVQYAAAVLTTHGAKVLVHLLYSNLIIMSNENK